MGQKAAWKFLNGCGCILICVSKSLCVDSAYMLRLVWASGWVRVDGYEGLGCQKEEMEGLYVCRVLRL